ncbi:hypothetical protein IGI39_001570 [Enterococcus sp. AZ135]
MNIIWGVIGVLMLLFLILWYCLAHIHYVRSTIKSPIKRFFLAMLMGILEIF